MLTYDLNQEPAMREQADVEHQQALRFKDALIDEMNHRTKNTLQMASNLLTMQARANSSAPVRDALLDGAARLHVLAKVHELLYANADRKQSVFVLPLMQSLGEAIRQSLGHAYPHVTLDLACEPMEMPFQDAVALALLANEVITNAYKHAFPNESGGAITVGLQRTSANAICLRIEDTGSGFASPAGAEGMGLKLIRTFAAQLRGALDVAAGGTGRGTIVTLTIAAPAGAGSTVRANHLQTTAPAELPG